MKNNKKKKCVIVPQQFHPNQIGEMSMFCVVIKENKLDDLFEFIVNNGGRVVSAIPCHGVSKNSFEFSDCEITSFPSRRTRSS